MKTNKGHNWLPTLVLVFVLLVLAAADRVAAAPAQASSSDLGQALNISQSGVMAQKLQLEVIAANIANLGTTSTAAGGPYRRKVLVLSQAPGPAGLGGVTADGVGEDPSAFKRVYNPAHPDADALGYVLMPNVDLATEMVDMTYASKLYEANVAVFNTSKAMLTTTMELGR